MTPLHTAINLYLRCCEIRGLKKNTISGYKERLTYFSNFVPITKLEELEPQTIESYILHLHQQPLSKATVATYLRPVKSFLHWAESELLISADLELSNAVKLPRAPARKVDILDNNQLQTLFSSIDTTDILSVRDGLILALMLDSGLRQNEVVQLKKNDINLSEHTMKVYGKGDKERYVPLGKFTADLIRRYLFLSEKYRNTPEAEKYLLLDRYGSPITPNCIKLMVSKKKRSSGINFSAHKLRHNFATNYCLDEYARSGSMDIFKLKSIMGHNNIETTMVYMHLAQELIAAKTSISHLDKIKIHL